MSESDFIEDSTSTFNMIMDENLDLEYYDLIKPGLTLKDLDYCMSRVTNSKDYSEDLIKHEYTSMNPRYKSVVILNNSREEMNYATNMTNTVSEFRDSTFNSTSIFNAENFNNLISCIELYSNSEDLLKMLSYFICVSDLSSFSFANNDKISDHVNFLSKHKGKLEFSVVTNYIGTRYKAEKTRSILLEIIENFYFGD